MAEDKVIKFYKPRKDLTGQRFGRLTVIAYSGNGRWQCICACGNEHRREHIATSGNLTQGHTTSCGCLQREMARARMFTNGLSATKESKAWNNARLRCYNTNNKDYPHYGGRGITMCAQWLHSSTQFIKDMGPCPEGMTLDRYDSNGNYEPGNCRWADRLTQVTNQRRTIRITHNGETLLLREWADRTGIRYDRLLWRYHRGESADRMFRPVRKMNKGNHG